MARFIQPDPLLDGLNRYTYCRNNPVKFVDPTGLKSIIYTSQDDYYIENDWGFWDFLNPDKYFAEIEGVKYEANSKETVTLYDWNGFDTGFLNNTLDSLVNTANQKPTDLDRVLNESIGGELDFKLQLDESQLFFCKWNSL